MIATRLSILGAALWIAAVKGFPIKEPTNAATRACAKGFTEWCNIPKREDYNVATGTSFDTENGVVANESAALEDIDADFSGFVGYKRADPIVNAATRACAKGHTEWCNTKRGVTITNAASRACANGRTEWCPIKRADTVTNAATRACAKGHIEWCNLPKREDSEELNLDMDESLKAELLQMIADESIEGSVSATAKNNKRCGPTVVNAATRACANGRTEWCPTKRGDTVTNAATRACALGRNEWCPTKRADTITNAATRACAKGFTEWCPVIKRDVTDHVEVQANAIVLRSEFVETEGDVEGFVSC